MARKKLNPINDLILFVLYSSSSKESSFGKLAKECFNQFPQVFSLRNYPQLLDTRKLDRPLRTLRKRKLIDGDPKTFSGQKRSSRNCQNSSPKEITLKFI